MEKVVTEEKMCLSLPFLLVITMVFGIFFTIFSPAFSRQDGLHIEYYQQY